MARTYNYSNPDSDTRKLLVQVTDAIKSDTDVGYFIDMADDYIDARLRGLYIVPFTTTPPMIKEISTFLGAYYTLATIKISTTDVEEAWVKKLKTHAMGKLEEISDGKIVLIDSTGSYIGRNTPFGVASNTEGIERTFNLGEWESMGVQE